MDLAGDSCMFLIAEIADASSVDSGRPDTPEQDETQVRTQSQVVGPCRESVSVTW